MKEGDVDNTKHILRGFRGGSTGWTGRRLRSARAPWACQAIAA